VDDVSAIKRCEARIRPARDHLFHPFLSCYSAFASFTLPDIWFWRNPLVRFARLNEGARRWAVRASFATKTKWVTSISLVGLTIQANGML
jgi:hypothetical protein